MIKRFLRDTKTYAGYTFYAAKAELKAEINSSYLSWIWLFLDPFCFMLIYTFIVKVVFQSNEPYLPIFVFIGISIWNFFNKGVIGSAKIVKSYKHIVKKTYIPKFILIYIRTLINGFKMGISFLIVAGMLIVYQVPITWNALFFLPIILLVCMVTFALSTVLLHFGTFVDDLVNVIGIVLRLVFYLSGIFYSIASRVPEPYGTLLVHYNPVAFMIQQMREILLFGQPIDYGWYFAWLLISICVSLIGISLIYKHENKYAKVI